MELNVVGNWIANVVLMSIGYITRLVFGSDKLSKKQLIAFYLFCIGVVWIVDKLNINSTIKSSIILCAGLVIPSFIRGVVKGSNSSEDTVAKTIKKSVRNISNKVDKIADVITDKKEDENDK